MKNNHKKNDEEKVNEPKWEEQQLRQPKNNYQKPSNNTFQKRIPSNK